MKDNRRVTDRDTDITGTLIRTPVTSDASGYGKGTVRDVGGHGTHVLAAASAVI
jgi:hypothetical protein